MKATPTPHSVNLAQLPCNRFLLIIHYCLVPPQVWGGHGPCLQELRTLGDK